MEKDDEWGLGLPDLSKYSDEVLEKFEFGLTRHFCFRRDGTPCSFLEAERLIRDHKSRVVKQETTASGFFVSTVFLVIVAPPFMEDGTGMLFETMVFSSNRSPRSSLFQARYRTEKDAIEGHKEVVESWTLRNPGE